MLSVIVKENRIYVVDYDEYTDGIISLQNFYYDRTKFLSEFYPLNLSNVISSNYLIDYLNVNDENLDVVINNYYTDVNNGVFYINFTDNINSLKIYINNKENVIYENNNLNGKSFYIINDVFKNENLNTISKIIIEYGHFDKRKSNRLIYKTVEINISNKSEIKIILNAIFIINLRDVMFFDYVYDLLEYNQMFDYLELAKISNTHPKVILSHTERLIDKFINAFLSGFNQPVLTNDYTSINFIKNMSYIFDTYDNVNLSINYDFIYDTNRRIITYNEILFI